MAATGHNILTTSDTISFRDQTTGLASISYDHATDSLSIAHDGTGAISFGDTASDIFIGDGVSSVDIIYEVDGAIKGDTSVNLTLGSSDSNLLIASENATITGSQIASQSWVGQQGFLTSETDDQTLDEVLTQGGTSTQSMRVGDITGSNLTLDDDSNIYANGSGYLRLGNNSGGQIYVSGNAGQSIISPVSNDLYIQTERDGDDIIFKGGASVTEIMRLDADTQRVGIGTTSPSQKLTVEGNIELGTGGYIYGDTTTPNLRLSNAAGALLQYGTSSLQNGGSLQFVTASGTLFRVNSGGGGYFNGGNVGIGTTTPLYKLEVAGQVQTHERLRIGSGGDNQDGELRARVIRLSNDTGNSTAKISSTGQYGRDLIYHALDHNFRYYTSTRLKLNQTEAVFNDDGADVDFRVEGSGEANALFVRGSDGNVGIGANPYSKLHVEGNTPIIQIRETSGAAEAGISINHAVSGNHVNFFIGTLDGNARKLTIGGTITNGHSTDTAQAAASLMLIDEQTGNVGIGTTSPGYKLEIADDTDSTVNLLRLRNSDTSYAQSWDFKLDTSKDLVITGGSGNGGVHIVPGNRGFKVSGSVTATSLDINGEANISDHLVVKGTSSSPLSSLFAGSLVVQGVGNEDPIIAVTDANTGGAAAGVFHQSSTSPTFPALVINAASSGSEQPLISARTNVSNTTGLGGTQVFAVDGDGDATFAGSVTATSLIKSGGSSSEFLKADGSVDSNTYISSETVTSLALTSGSLVYTNESGTANSISLAAYLDEDSRSIASGSLNSTSGIVTFTRDDSTTFTLDLSDLLDDTNLVTSVAGKSGVVSLVKGDVGLGNVTNESKATMFSSPALTGSPTAPTPSLSDDNTNIATTEYVKGQNYLTSFTEADTLGTVVSRGATTTSAITLGPSATNGGRILSQTYSGSSRLGVLSSHYSSGSFLLGFGAEGKSGANGYVSTYDNFSGGHNVLILASSTLSWRADSSNSQTTVGNSLTLSEKFKVDRSGVLTMGDGFTSTKGNTAYTHTSDTNNPHSVTKTQVGLGSVTNESKATMFSSPTFTGDVGFDHKKVYGLQRTVPTTVDDIVEIGNTNLSSGAGHISMQVVVASSSFSVTKSYTIPIAYSETSGAWNLLNSTYDTGSYSSNDFEVDIKITASNIALRIRRTSGSTTGLASVNLELSGATLSFTETSSTASVTAPTAYYNPNVISQKQDGLYIGGTRKDTNWDTAYTHTSATNNPHGVTASQVGAYTSAETSTLLAAKAPLASPTFTGNPKAPTPSTSDNDTSIATTAFVKAQNYLTASSTNTLTNKTWNGNVIASAYLDSDTAHLSTTQTFSGAKTFSNSTVDIAQDLRHSGDTDTYLRMSPDLIRIVAGNVDMIRFTESTQNSVVINEGGADVDFRVEGNGEANALFVRGSDGNVGIGTTSPSERLHIHNSTGNGATIRLSDPDSTSTADATGYIEVYHGEATARAGYFGLITNSEMAFATTTSAGKIRFYTANNTTALTIDSSQNIDAVGSVTAYSFIKEGGANSEFLKADGGVDSNTYLTTSSASSTYLPLAGGTMSGAIAMGSNNITGGGSFSANLFSVGNEGKVVSTSTLGLQLQATAGSKPITFYTNVGGNTERMRITHDGNVGIGTTTPSSKLHVAGTASIDTLEYNSIVSVFGQSRTKLNELSDVFYQADKRFTVTGGHSRFFNGNFDQSSTLTANTTNVININVAGQSGVPSNGITYPQGAVYISFYYTNNAYTAISLRHKSNGVYYSSTGTNVSNNSSYKVIKFPISGNNYLTDIEISITTDATNLVKVAGINYLADRWTTQLELPYVSKYLNSNTVFGEFNVANTSGVANHKLDGDVNSYLAANAGNVGIGTNSPAGKLEIKASTYAGTIKFKQPDGSAPFVGSTAGTAMVFQNYSGVDKAAIYVDNSGNFTIGGADIHLDGVVSGDRFKALTGGSLAFPSIQLDGTNGDESGLYLPATNQIGVITDRLERLRIDASGNVGIGTTSPAEKLHVNGIIRTHNSTETKYINVFGGNSGNFIDTYGNSLYLRYGGDSSKAILLDSAGNVGIGTTSPDHTLRVNGDARLGNLHIKTSDFGVGGTGKTIYADGAGSGVLGFISSTAFDFSNGTTSRLHINSSGNVGIGIANPNDILQVKSSMSIVDSNGTNVHCQLFSNASEGVLRIYNGANWGLIARGQSNNPYLGAYYGGSLNIVGFSASDGSTIQGTLATFDFSNSQFKLYDDKQLVIGNGADLRIFHNGSNSYIHNDTGNIYIENDATDGDILFRSDDGSGSVTDYLRLDGGQVKTFFSKTTIHTDGVEAQFGSGADLKIYHTGSDSYIDDIGTGSLYIRGANDVNIRSYNGGAGEQMIKAIANGAVELYHDNAKKFETFASGISVTGSVNADQLHLGDNDKALFGNSNDLQIYHNGSASYIDDTGTGNLFVRANAQFVVQKYTGETLFKGIADGAVELYHDNVKKFETTASGIQVIGTNEWDIYSDNTAATFDLNSTTRGFLFKNGNGNLVTIDNNGRVGIGVTPSSAELEVNGHFAATTKSFIIDNPKTGGKLQYGVVESDEHGVYVRGKSDQEVVELPEEWDWLVHEDSVTVQLTSVGQMQQLFVVEQNNKRIKVSGLAPNGQYNYVVHGTRKDVDALEKHLK